MLDKGSNGLLVCVTAIVVGCGSATGLPMMDESLGGAGQEASSGKSGTNATGGYTTTYPGSTGVFPTTSASGGYTTTYSTQGGGAAATNATGGTWNVTATTSTVATGGSTSSMVWDGAACAIVPPCGGDIRGTWVLDSECTQGAMAYANTELGALYSGCDSVMGAFGVNAAGMVEYTETLEIAKTTSTVTTGSFYSKTCIASINGQQSATATTDLCNQIANNIISAQDSASGQCGLAGQGCKCWISAENSQYSESTYATQGTQLIYPKDDSAMSYCVQGNMLTLMAAPPDAPYTVVVTMHRN